MFGSLKKIFSSALLLALLSTTTACGNDPGLTTVDLIQDQQQVQAESFWNRKEGSLPDNGDINIKIDNVTLARRTFNNASPQIFIDGKEAYPEVERLIDSAQKSIYVEMFLFQDDASGRRMADKLIARQRQGIDVKILIDKLGLLSRKSDLRIYDYLVSQKMDVRTYNKSILGFTGINITHRKLILIDGETGMTGGMNLGDTYAFQWHDTLTEFQGEVVQAMQNEFFTDWTNAGGKIPAVTPKLPSGKVYGNTPMRVVITSAPESRRRYEIRLSTMEAINSAKDRIYLSAAYLSDDDLIDALVNAKKRGVDLNVVIPQKGDSPIYNTLNLNAVKKLVQVDAKVYFYQPRFTHTKALIADSLTIVGSANTDARSFRENQELNVIIEDNNFQQNMLSRLFQNDINQSKPATLDSVKNVSIIKKLAISALEILDYYL